MLFISHRVNSVDKLKATPRKFGIEVDIRSCCDRLIVNHDPFKPGVEFDAWVRHFQHKLLLLNVKEEGLELRLEKKLSENHITDYFFLDQSFPFLIKFSKFLKGRSAVRFSEYESLETVLNLSGKVNWVWVDCFSRFPLSEADTKLLKEKKFKICLVSPELHGRKDCEEIKKIANQLNKMDCEIDAICTKQADFWSDVLC